MSSISPHAFAPHCFVEASIDANVRSAHLLHGELADFLDGPRSPSLETPARGTFLNMRDNRTVWTKLVGISFQRVARKGWQKGHSHEQRIDHSEEYIHSMDALVDVDGILSCHNLVDG